tara:strand:- start:17243 stop:17569 length:327 start_codon:yes stop_codon:yes gene_type:complete
MIRGLKRKAVTWFLGNKLGSWLKDTAIPDAKQKAMVKTIQKVVSNIMQNKPTIKNEPVMYGGAITVAVALAGAFGLDLTVEQLSITLSTVIAVVSFVQRKFVSPAKEQ